MKNILFFDTETTGLPVNFNAPYTDVDNWPRLVQLAWQRYSGEVLIAESVAVIYPNGFEIPEAASRIHGITMEQALLGTKINFALHGIERALNKVELVVCHNYWFDFPIVAAEMHRVGMVAAVEILEKTPWCCTKESGTDLCKIPKLTGYYKNSNKYKWPSLDELHQFLFGEPIAGREEFHDALTDVRATARCYFEMQRRLIDPNYTKATIL